MKNQQMCKLQNGSIEAREVVEEIRGKIKSLVIEVSNQYEIFENHQALHELFKLTQNPEYKISEENYKNLLKTKGLLQENNTLKTSVKNVVESVFKFAEGELLINNLLGSNLEVLGDHID